MKPSDPKAPGRYLASVGNRIRELRELKRWSQDELAEKAGVPRGLIAHLEAHRRADTGIIGLVRIAAALEVPITAVVPPMSTWERG